MVDEPSVNRPESGAYGEKQDLVDLEQSLPPMEGPPGPPPQAPGVAGPPPAGTPVPLAGSQATPGRPPGAVTAPPGVPNVLMHDEPMGGLTPTDPTGPTNSMAPSHQTLYILDVLSTSNDVSSETREWAAVVLDLMLGATT